MSWTDHRNADSLPWLLEAGALFTRHLALRDLLGVPAEDKEYRDALKSSHQEGPIAAILAHMEPEGYWVKPGAGYGPKYQSTVWSVIMLAQLGARLDQDARVETACNYILEHALTEGGHFSASSGPSDTADCLQGNCCWALLELGVDPSRLEKAFEWMARTVTGEGIAPNSSRMEAVRYYAGKCGPDFACGANNKLPCAWGAAKVMLALGKLPASNRTALIERAIQRGVDFFFSVDPATAAYPCGWTSKPSSNWWKFGFPIFYVTDLLQVVEALVSLGYGKDPRLANALNLIRQKQDAQGRWALEYDYNGKTWVELGEKKAPNPWVTLRALRVLKAVG